MDEMNYTPDQNWDRDTYRTGKTRPPKRRSGLIAILLIVVIFLSGIASAMGLLNIRLFRKIADQTPPENTTPLSFSHMEVQNGTKEQDLSFVPEDEVTEDTPAVDLQPSPEAAENIPQAGGLSLQEIYVKTIDSVVSIGCVLPNGTSTGTGVVLSQDGYLVTNCHVVEGAQSIAVSFTDQRQLSAQIIGTDAVSDLAVLRVDADDLVPAQFGDSSSIRVGDLAVAIGDPLGLELRGTMTDGIISAINRDITTGGRTMTLLQTNAALNSGNSGGPLLNCYGQVIGINTMKIGDYMNSAGVEGLGFAIPSTTVKDIVDQLISQGYVSGRPDLGIIGEDISRLYQYLYNLPQGVYISQVDQNSNAYEQGIRSGDILVELDGQRIYSTQDLVSMLYAYQAGQEVELIIYRSGNSYRVQVTLSQAVG